MESMLPFLVVIPIILLVVGGIIVAKLLQKKRRQAISAVAQEFCFSFAPKGDGTIQARLTGLHLFDQGHSRRVTNVLHGEAKGIEVAILDYRYITGGGKNSQTHKQTVIAFWSPMLSLPLLSLRPEHIFHRIGAAFGYQDIDFSESPAFSKRYLLRGQREDAIRNVFDRSVLSYFEGTKGLSVEGAADCLAYYKAGVRVKPQEYRTFMEEGFQIFALLARE